MLQKGFAVRVLEEKGVQSAEVIWGWCSTLRVEECCRDLGRHFRHSALDVHSRRPGQSRVNIGKNRMRTPYFLECAAAWHRRVLLRVRWILGDMGRRRRESFLV